MDFYRIFASSYRLTNIFSSKNIKKILLFVLIGVVLFLVFSNNAFAVEDDEFDGFTEISWINLLNTNLADGHIVENEGHNMQYFHLDSNYIYKIYNTTTNTHSFYYTTSEPQIGVPASFFTNLGAGQVQTIPGNSNFYLNANSGTDTLNGYKIYAKPYRGSPGVVQDLTSELSPSSTWSQLGFAVPLIGIAVLFALGFFVVRKVTKGEGKAKVKF